MVTNKLDKTRKVDEHIVATREKPSIIGADAKLGKEGESVFGQGLNKNAS